MEEGGNKKNSFSEKEKVKARKSSRWKRTERDNRGQGGIEEGESRGGR